jgi:transcriptional regulator with XRE-family HTH domain
MPKVAAMNGDGNVGRALAIEAERRALLRTFLRDRRARLKPHDVGLTAGSSRRSPGLRREDVAMLSGMSVNWYTLLETGQNDTISPAALANVARALHLSDQERAYLGALARVALPALPHATPPDIPARLLELLDELGDRPAVIWNRRRDAVAWNAMSVTIFGYSVTSPLLHRNGWWRIFRHPNRHRIWADWDAAARRAVAALRWQFSREPEIVYDLLVDLQTDAAFREHWETDSDVTDWMHEPTRDIEVQLPGRSPIRLEPITLMLPGSDAHLVQIHRHIDAGIAHELTGIFAIESSRLSA